MTYLVLLQPGCSSSGSFERRKLVSFRLAASSGAHLVPVRSMILPGQEDALKSTADESTNTSD